MILSAVATLGFAAIAMLPGWLALRGRARHPGEISAAMAVSLTLSLLLTALAGALWHAITAAQLPASSIAVTSALMAVLVHVERRRGIDPPGGTHVGVASRIEWEAIILAVVFVIFGIFSLALAVVEGEGGDLFVHTWYNADWFKHIGHVHALANAGVPARDIFGGGNPLYYYWLFYLLPGAGAATGGDAWAALSAANALVGFLFITTLHAAFRLASGRGPAIIAVGLILFAAAPIEAFVRIVTGETMAQIVAEGELLLGPTLVPLVQFVPQHTLATTVFLAWAILARQAGAFVPTRRMLLVLFALGAILTISTLLGAVLLVAYGLAELYRRREKALFELTAMVVLVIVLTFAIGVLQIGRPDSALESPLFINPPNPDPWYLRSVKSIVSMIGYCGVPAILAIFAFRRWQPEDEHAKWAWTLALALFVSSLLAVAVTQSLAPPRIAIETLLRCIIPLSIAIGIVGAWALGKAWSSGPNARRKTALVLTLCVIVAAPHFYARTAWMADFSNRAFTRIPLQDRQVLTQLRRLSEPGDEVWQHPETPAFAQDRGDDNWSAIFAGRTVSNSLRATDYTSAAGAIERSQRFFAGEDVGVPEKIDWVYLSRHLHPDSFDALRMRLLREPDFARRACYEDACLFERRRASRP